MTNHLKNVAAKGLLLTFIACLSFALVAGQNVSPHRGFMAGGAYSLSDIESINTNVNNGNLMFNFALGKLPPGRTGLSALINLHYSSKIYDSHIQYYQDFEYASPPDYEPVIVPQNVLWGSDRGGWQYGLGYQLILVDRVAQYYETPTYGDDNGIYRWKVKMAFPDGSVREFLPRGFGTNGMGDGFYNFRPDGWQTAWSGTQPGSPPIDVPGLAGDTHYYTFDGSYLRLDIQHDSNASPWDNAWTLTFPDGTSVSQSITQPQRTTDRNGNYTQIEYITYNGNPAPRIVDQMGRQIVIESTVNNSQKIHSTGPGGADVAYEVIWKLIQVGKMYRTVDMFEGPNPNGYPEALSSLNVVSEIKLPSPNGNLKYTFGYNAHDYGTVPWGTPSVGLGEVSSLTLPSGAQVQYQYTLDNQNGPEDTEFKWDNLLKNAVTKKTLTFQEEYDGSTTPVTQTWLYPGWGVVNPDGGAVVQVTDTQRTYSVDQPDGKRIENVWASNKPQGFATINEWNQVDGFNPYDPSRANGFIKWQLTSIRDASNNFVKTAIKAFTVDKNGNTTTITEYDWVPYPNVPRDAYGWVTGIPAGAVVLRVTTNTLARPTPNSTDSSTNSADSYWNYSSPNLRSAIASTELSNGSTTLTRQEYVYDNSGTTGNQTQQKVWDSTKGALTRPLTSGNSVTTSSQYDANGNVTSMTDARGFQTTITYGSINGFTNLYPTQTITSNGTGVARTTTKEYDFATGLVTRVTDVNNSVSTFTTYDNFGRPTLVKTAEGNALETQTATEYSDANRRVIARSDLTNVGDGKLVTVQHYDQLGRIRLVRQLEDSATQSATDETTGIKTQTRYRIVNPCAPVNDGACLTANSAVLASYELVSNPYRAATSSAASSEPTMGWRRTRQDVGGRLTETQTFGSATLPAPWGASSVSTGTVTMSYDANFTTSADQRGKLRRSMVDGLGRLIRVDEPNASNVLGSTTSPNQPTTYSYDARGNLISVDQNTGVQAARTFTYSSMARLVSSFQPETGTVTYQYDDAGNLLVQTDARGVSTHYSYDALSRMIRRWYNGSSSIASTTHNSPALPAGVGATAEVNLFYDSQSLPAGAPSYTRGASAGRLVAKTYGGGSNGTYLAYDVLGRTTTSIQQTGSVNYQTSATYNRADVTTAMTYPSGRTITNSLDTAGRLSGMTGNLGDGTSRAYTSGILYSAFGTQVKEQFGTTTPIYNKLFYNSRAQLAEIRESTSYTGPTDTTWDRGAIVNNYSDQCTGQCVGAAMTDNNGFLVKQSIYIPSQAMRWQQFDYDSLNRLNWVREVLDGGAEQWKQQFTYDRYGNRTINNGVTYGIGINNKAFTVTTANNRLQVPGGQPGTMTYDVVGNLTNDTYTGAGNRTYNAENKITSAWGGNNQAQLYTYDASGNRIKRIVDAVETWQVYGIGGHLVAEYPANGPAASPQREYGYRNGQLLIRAGPSSDIRWLVTDHLGTPRMIFDLGGSLANVKRHDYLPFGEELFAPTGGRSAAQGYSSDGVRQQFTGKERDAEIQLDYSKARYYSPVQGRFTGPDPLLTSGKTQQPQSWNRYTYCINAPSVLVDPTGLIWGVIRHKNGDIKYRWFLDREQMEAYGAEEVTNFVIDMGDGTWAALDPNSGQHTQGLINQWEAKRTLWRYQGLQPSWQDWIPVWGQTRQFLFNYTVGNYEQALINFSAASIDGGTMAAGFANSAGRQVATQAVEEAGEAGVLRFSQKTASQAFSEAGDFAGETIGSLAAKIRSGEIPVEALKVGVVDGADGVRLIVNTRTSLALRRAGVPQSSWNIVDMTSTQGSNIADRLLRNGLSNEGTDVLRITGWLKNTSSLQ